LKYPLPGFQLQSLPGFPGNDASPALNGIKNKIDRAPD